MTNLDRLDPDIENHIAKNIMHLLFFSIFVVAQLSTDIHLYICTLLFSLEVIMYWCFKINTKQPAKQPELTYTYQGSCPYGHTSNFQHRSADNPDMSVLSKEEELNEFTALM